MPDQRAASATTSTRGEREQIEWERRDFLLSFPPFTLLRCGWRTPSGRVQGTVYYRTGDGLGPVGEDRTAVDVLRYAAAYHLDDRGQPWGVDILARPGDEIEAVR